MVFSNLINVSGTYTVDLAIAVFLWKYANNKPSASSSLDRLSSIVMLVDNFMLDRTASSSAMYFSVCFWWIYCYNLRWAGAHVLV